MISKDRNANTRRYLNLRRLFALQDSFTPNQVLLINDVIRNYTKSRSLSVEKIILNAFYLFNYL